MYLAWYGFGRAIIESLRTDSLMVGPFKVSLLLGVFFCAASITLILVIRKKLNEKSVVYENVFDEEIEAEEVEENVQAD